VEIAKRGIEAFNELSVETIDELATPDFEWFPAIPVTVGGGVYRGRRGVEAYFEEIRSTWRELRIVVDEFRDLGDRVLMLGRIKGRGMSSGIEVDTPLAIVFDLRGGRAWRSRGFFDRAEALKAVGLED
jgi:ketosteroid isomerase-like protein